MSAAIRADEPAEAAVAGILLRLFDGVMANVAGTLADTDPECLHDLRVGVRRTRSLLKLTGDVLPDGLASRYARPFRWLGTLTTPVRDLDVQLLGFDELAAGVPAARRGELEPYRRYLREERAARFEQLTRGLTGTRFAQLRDGWRSELSAVTAEPAGPAAGVLAEQRIDRARRAVAKRAGRLTHASPPGDVHDLRKRAKELRYLLEAFGPVYADGGVRRTVRELKRLQDVLGAYQDAEVQLTAVRDYASREAPAPAALADLVAVLETRRERARSDLVARLDGFLSRSPAAPA
ncbi:MAG: CHAD domain-containing protein [Acidothermales bacterium]|nr:CHAD domain-containing protein [Acidothermales bacterium]